MSTLPGSFARQILSRVADELRATARGPERPLEHLRRLRHAQWLIEVAENKLIEAARLGGATWGDIARARATSRQNERQAYARRRAASDREPFDRWIDAIRDQRARDRKQGLG